jgi:mono/diheme cytochrome c family protein
VRTVATASGDEPNRAIAGPDGIAFVAARAGGAVLAVNLATLAITRAPVCGAPRGLAYDASASVLHVACGSGALVTLDANTLAVVTSANVGSDLRDVIVHGDELVVSRFRSAELLTLDRAGAVKVRHSLKQPGSGPSAAFRTVVSASGAVTVVHQSQANTVLGGGFGAYYGGTCWASVSGSTLSTLSLDGSALPSATPAATTTIPEPVTPEAPIDPRAAVPEVATTRSSTLVGMVGPFDLATSPDGSRLAVLGSGNAWVVGKTRPTLALLSFATGVPEGNMNLTECTTPASNGYDNQGEPVAVAFDAAGSWLVQSREPATLEREDGRIIELSTSSRFDSGLALFHMNSGANIACASCHPGGAEDGHTWHFSDFGLRRSQGLEGGGAGLAPFHWRGELATFEALYDEVMVKRMNLTTKPPSTHVVALRSWLDTIPAPPPADHLDPASVERGRVLFSDTSLRCSTCHSGPRFTDDAPHDVGTGGEFVTPSLLGVHLRSPLMHDGCAKDLKARFGPCGGDDRHGAVDALPESAIDDLVTYMRSL